MPQMLRLSQGHWLNLETLVEVREMYEPVHLLVACAVSSVDDNDVPQPYTLYLMGEERERLLAWLAHHSAYVDMPRADNDDENDEPPF